MVRKYLVVLAIWDGEEGGASGPNVRMESDVIEAVQRTDAIHHMYDTFALDKGEVISAHYAQEID